MKHKLRTTKEDCKIQKQKVRVVGHFHRNVLEKVAGQLLSR